MGTAPDPGAYSYSATGYDVTDELYQIDTATPDPRLDKDGSQLAAITAPPLDTTSLSTVQQQAYTQLKAVMAQHDAVASYNQAYDTANCPGDGDRKSAVAGKSVSVRVDLGGRRFL